MLARGCLALPQRAVLPDQHAAVSHPIRLITPRTGPSAHASLTHSAVCCVGESAGQLPILAAAGFDDFAGQPRRQRIGSPVTPTTQ